MSQVKIKFRLKLFTLGKQYVHASPLPSSPVAIIKEYLGLRDIGI